MYIVKVTHIKADLPHKPFISGNVSTELADIDSTAVKDQIAGCLVPTEFITGKSDD